MIKKLILRPPKRTVELDMACIQARKEMPPVQKNTANKHANRMYANIDDVLIAIEDVMFKYNLSPWHKRVWKDDKEFFYTIIKHGPTGQYRDELRPYIPDNGKGMNVLQAQGSAETYMRRYALNNLLGLRAGDLDDDGNQGKEAPKKEAEPVLIDISVSKLLNEFASFENAEGLISAYCKAIGVDKIEDMDLKERNYVYTQLQLL